MTPQVAPKGDRVGGNVPIEFLECRVLLSVSSVWRADAIHTFQVLHTAAATPYVGAAASGITPAQMTQAYGVNQIRFGTVAGNGAGQTIALIDAFDDPNALADLTAFDSYYGLPNPPSFLKLNESGSATSLPGVDPSPKGNTWELEESLDIEWAHTIAPQANLILYEANSPAWTDLISAVGTAASNSAVTAVSMSFGSPEQTGETYYDGSFNAANATFLASTGDTGGGGSYPASSPNVVAVGGTGLSVDSSGNYLGESAWSGSNGGISTQEAEPAWQQSVQSTGWRTTPDVAMDADPATGVPVYDSFDGGAATPWFTVGGTSLATPMWAGLIAIADQGRTINGLAPLTSTQAHQMLYSAPAGDFHDVTAGGNTGFGAGPGYDEVTGRGSPVANLLVPYLAGSAATQPSPPATASFTGVDFATQGTWGGTYGADGYDIFNDSASLPAYAQLSTAGAQSWTWASPTANPRAMQNSPGASTRTASCLYSGSSFSLDLNLTDGAPHSVALYLSDYDGLGRVETVQVTDAATGAVLDSRTAYGFGSGQYLDYTLSGHVRINFSNNDPAANAVVSGILFGQRPPAAASFAGVNASTQGNWTGAYGASGSWVAYGASAVPSYATMSFANQQSWLWGTSTTIARYLQTGPGAATRVAGCVYSPSSFSLDLNLTDGQTHRVSFYLLDWEPIGRTETIQVTDAVSGRVLDTQNASSYGTGRYLSWNLSGHVKLTFTNTGPYNAVLSGIFFDPIPGQAAATSSTHSKADVRLGGNGTGFASTPGARTFRVGSGSANRIEACTFSAASFSLAENRREVLNNLR